MVHDGGKSGKYGSSVRACKVRVGVGDGIAVTDISRNESMARKVVGRWTIVNWTGRVDRWRS